MNEKLSFKDMTRLPIDWDLSPEMAVTLYLEWGNNNWRSPHPPVRSPQDIAYYFVIDAWKRPLAVRLVRRSSESAEDLAEISLPAALEAAASREYGMLKGVFEPLPEIKDWLRGELDKAW